MQDADHERALGQQLLQFLAALLGPKSNAPPRKAYYPGAQERFQAFLQTDAEMLGERTREVVPWTLLPEVPAEAGEYAMTSEAFCGVLGKTNLPTI